MNLNHPKASSLPAFHFLDLQSTPSTKSPDSLEACSYHSQSVLGVKQASAWSYCGPLLSATSLPSMPLTFQKWQAESIDGDLLPVLLPFLDHANELLRRNNLQHYWITIRATQPDDEFEIPRWHTDDLFYERYLNGTEGERTLGGRHLWPTARRSERGPTDWKLIATLSGPPTLFIAPAHQKHARALQRQAKIKCGKEHVCDSIRCVGCSTAASHVRETLNVQLRDTEVVRPGVGQGVFLRVGHERGVVHSEPDLRAGDRVFVNVVPGREGELAGLMRKWGMEFPREWAVVEG
jgi:hypothetical protein